jgi:hypothetical protein
MRALRYRIISPRFGIESVSALDTMLRMIRDDRQRGLHLAKALINRAERVANEQFEATSSLPAPFMLKVI